MTEFIEHTDVEVDDPVESPEAHEHPAAPADPNRPSVHDVLVECLALRLPCPVCAGTNPCRCLRPVGYSETNERADLVEQALVLYGYLPKPDEGGGGFDPEETAQWLANRSGFARYTQVTDGWRRLLEAEADVELAAIKAGRRVPSEEVEMVKAARAALLAWHEAGQV